MFWLALRVISDGNEGFNFDKKKEYQDDLRLNVYEKVWFITKVSQS
jgi:hypothetical protein